MNRTTLAAIAVILTAFAIVAPSASAETVSRENPCNGVFEFNCTYVENGIEHGCAIWTAAGCVQGN